MTETINQAVGNAVARRNNGPRALVAEYATEFRTVLPSHIKPDQWVRIAQGALKKGKKVSDGSGRTELEVAAANNPGIFLATLLEAARLGLEPGTDEFYLVPRKVKGRLEIQGIVGYQGIVERIYRAGAVASVVAEVVFTGDAFRYRPGADERPIHEIDWDVDDRGDLRLAYAYAIMKDGATSKVVVLNKSSIARIKAKATGADSPYSPWQTDEAAMWLKSAARQLQKWVPTSSEYRREQLRAVQAVAAETTPHIPAGTTIDVTALPEVSEDVLDGEVLDGEDASDEQDAPAGDEQ